MRYIGIHTYIDFQKTLIDFRGPRAFENASFTSAHFPKTTGFSEVVEGVLKIPGSQALVHISRTVSYPPSKAATANAGGVPCFLGVTRINNVHWKQPEPPGR